MGEIVVNREANKPLTEKRIFEAKLHGYPLCVSLNDVENNIQMLVDNGVFINEHEYLTYEFKIGYPIYVTYCPWHTDNLLDRLEVGQKYTVPN